VSIQERYNPKVVGANATVNINTTSMGGFLCTASGTITLVSKATDSKAQTTLLNAMSVSAGVYYPIPVYLGSNGGTFTTASSAAGLLLV
jgi:hypothetical protein